MSKIQVYREVRAVHHDGVLRLLDPLELPDGAQVRISVQVISASQESQGSVKLIYPTRLVPADRLDGLTGIVKAGGNALADSEALYDAGGD